MARLERFKSWKDTLEKNRNMVLYVLVLLGGLCLITAWGLLPDVEIGRASCRERV